MDLDEAADELYGLLPEQFVGRRRELAAQARQAGDRTLAAAVSKLARPTTSAWLVNIVVRADAAQVGELLDLGAGLRDAQARLDADELRHLSARRHAVVAAVARAARGLAAGLGHPVGDQAERELGQTLAAALADPAAAEAVRSGRLTKALQHVGLGPVDLAGAVAGPVAAAAGPVAAAAGGSAARPPRAVPDGRHSPDAGGQRQGDADDARRRDDLRAALAAAENDTAQARRRRDEHAAAASAVRGRATDLERRVAELAAELDRARQEAAGAAAEAAAAERLRTEATRAVERAEQRRAQAQAELDRLDRLDFMPAPAPTDR